ncbi:MAG TPA: transcription antitermination factor NusB [Planctomycetota bacterium]|jgi:N utilization substance protein B|nr:transcription antitermination factor NusB [Planctomycetota bacterium]
MSEKVISDQSTPEKAASDKSGAKDGGKSGAKRSDLRSRGRELALQLLYSFEQNKFIDDGMLAPTDATDGMEAESIEFARALQAGFAKERPAIDAAVDKRLENWTIHRLAVSDRAILRLGAYEILYCADTPAKVAINEYIELAKRYGSEAKTPKLVNAVLDKIAREHRAGDVKAK